MRVILVGSRGEQWRTESGGSSRQSIPRVFVCNMHRFQLFQNSFRDHNHTHKPHPNVLGHTPVTTPIVMKIGHVIIYLCSYCSWQIRQKSTVQYGRSLNARPGQRKQMDFYFRHKVAGDHPVPTLAIRTFPHAPQFQLRTYTSRARVVWLYRVTLALTKINYASPRAAAWGLALTHTYSWRGASALIVV